METKRFDLYNEELGKWYYNVWGAEAPEAGKNEWKTLCIFHPETHPSLLINDKKGTYHCFGCDKKGKAWESTEHKEEFSTATATLSAERAIVEALSLDDAVIKANDLINLEIPEPKSILKPWITEESITLIAGWRGTGKTWFSLGIANAITMGYPKFGCWDIVTPVPCLYVDGEMSLFSMKQRLNLLGHTEKQEKAPLLIYSNALANAKEKPSTNLYNPEHREIIRAICKKEGIKVVFIDNISSMAPGEDENAKKDWDCINQWLLSLRFMGVSTIMLHHTGKSGSQRGTTGREDNVDHSILLSHPSDYIIDDGIRFRINFTKNRVDYQNLPLIKEVEFKGIKGNFEGRDRLYLNYEPVALNKTDLIKERLGQGAKVKDIAAELEVSERYIYRVKKEIGLN